ncbi:MULTISPECIES: NAD(P)/FAD-dependent oxidoreductase [unclassified Streptomyces]|uniref:flavin monoamine oxidase family protein n=1 Tax=unclassified Streptomyces TaxID=2593676 RepID=UPI00278BCD3E|nr:MULTISPECIES: NAD(P)/FAD-dependent oxidoreductase [unclassified Streptomyces]
MWTTTPAERNASESAPPTDPRAHIAVLGAGIAGLVAACELESLGYRVTILEGSERIGGRIYTHRFGTTPGAPYAELGAMRIPATHELTLRYVKELGLEPDLHPFRTILSDENNYLATKEGHVRVKDASGPLLADLRREIPTESYRTATVLFGAWLAAMVRAVAPAELRDNLVSDLTALLPLADSIDLTPYVYGDEADRIRLGPVFRDHPELRAACSPRLYGFLDDLLLETDTDLFHLAGGMSRIVDRLVARIRGPILLGHEVTGVHAGGDAAGVELRTGGRTETLRYPAVLCTLPFSVLRGLTLTGFDEDKRDIVAGVEYGAATKVALHCRDAFWERDGIRGGASATGGRTRQTYYPPREGDPAEGAVLLGSYAIAEDADLLGLLPAEARHAATVEELAPLYPQLKEPGAVLGAASIAWAGHPWSKGCTARRWRWGNDADGCAREVRRASRPQGRLFFAGEHCSTTPAWINGAIESALAAVAGIGSTLKGAR